MSIQMARNLLSIKERYLLSNWLMKQRGRFLTERPPKVEVAEDVSKVLGFRITEANVRAHCRELGIDWTAKRYTYNTMRNKSVILARAIMHIAEELDIRMNDELIELAGETAVDDDEDKKEQEKVDGESKPNKGVQS